MTPKDRLLHITDLHFWSVVTNPFALLNKRFLGNANVIYRRSREFHMAQAEPYTEHVSTLGINDCLLGGDFTSTATPAEFERGRVFVDGLANRGMHIHLMPGNHDVYTFESLRKKRFEHYFAPYLPDGGYPSRNTLPGGTPLIMVPTVCPNWLSSAGNITNTEVAAVRTRLEECPDGPILVAGHYPILHQTKAYDSGKSRQFRNADALRKALGESGRRILYVAGHVHRFSYTRDRHYPNLCHLTTGAFFLQRRGETESGAFSTIAVNEDGFQVEWHGRQADWTMQQAELDEG